MGITGFQNTSTNWFHWIFNLVLPEVDQCLRQRELPRLWKTQSRALEFAGNRLQKLFDSRPRDTIVQCPVLYPDLSNTLPKLEGYQVGIGSYGSQCGSAPIGPIWKTPPSPGSLLVRRIPTTGSTAGTWVCPLRVPDVFHDFKGTPEGKPLVFRA